MSAVPYSLKSYNTFQIDHSCAELIHAESKAKLISTCLELYRGDQDFLVLGGGSNIVLTEDYLGTVVHVETKGVEFSEDDEYHYLSVAAGENWHELVVTTLSMSISGLENLALIPGTVGAAPIQNIGAYGVELMQLCDWVEYLDLRTGGLKRLTAQECLFKYRDSIFKGDLLTCAVITGVGLKLSKQWQPVISYGPLRAFEKGSVTAKQIFDCICNMRNTKLPNPDVLGNAGSFFKNPIVSRAVFDSLVENHPGIVGYPMDDDSIKLAAGWLIDRAGLKCLKVGDAAVHEQQALVLVNMGQARGKDVTQLARQVIRAVAGRYGIELEAEPRIIGANGERELADD
ncbi:UDP-N-acetylmuramate dehydrogenase [Shewanella violacea]|uniref:UDP-N-acetylenolpyruvoylglucosamine reductase n=1 Tax=Shewanella violacea (strain JCM 10179 / CIP 106290 / LMG 19151 / DSS12) TaxID=637905 RepID=D4ZE89_SHEVD|nr:UDP-N-acetylmuramate dehydrogenase [Shewanella violacea]BAJ04150.1 UDP-N-acetylenolpyruvoylglucosamine reductase [Shewanella violacea DSS12]